MYRISPLDASPNAWGGKKMVLNTPCTSAAVSFSVWIRSAPAHSPAPDGGSALYSADGPNSNQNAESPRMLTTQKICASLARIVFRPTEHIIARIAILFPIHTCAHALIWVEPRLLRRQTLLRQFQTPQFQSWSRFHFRLRMVNPRTADGFGYGI